MSKRLYLQNLCNKYGDFLVTTSIKEGSEIKWYKHRSVMDCWSDENKLHFLDEATHRTPHPHEVVLDFDDNPTAYKITKVCEELENLGFKYVAFFTGSRGYHVHIIDLNLNKEERDILITKFGAEDLKKSDKSMVALEFTPHWKTGKNKTMIRSYPKRLGEELWQLWKD